jgi:chromosome segregation ATPase
MFKSRNPDLFKDESEYYDDYDIVRNLTKNVYNTAKNYMNRDRGSVYKSAKEMSDCDLKLVNTEKERDKCWARIEGLQDQVVNREQRIYELETECKCKRDSVSTNKFVSIPQESETYDQFDPMKYKQFRKNKQTRKPFQTRRNSFKSQCELDLETERAIDIQDLIEEEKRKCDDKVEEITDKLRYVQKELQRYTEELILYEKERDQLLEYNEKLQNKFNELQEQCIENYSRDIGREYEEKEKLIKNLENTVSKLRQKLKEKRSLAKK